MGTVLDLLLLLVIAKEALELGTDLSPELWAVFVVGLPFLLGMAWSMREDRSSIVRNPIRAMIGEGLTLVTVLLFLILITYKGLAAAFGTLFVVMVLPYGLGRLVGMTAKGLILFGAILVGMYLFGGVFGDAL